MDAVHSTPRLINRNRAFSDSVTPRGRASSEPSTLRNEAPSSRHTDENRAPATVPKGLESMLKMTTETGDIGVFSTKSSRVPHGDTTPRKAPGRYSDEPQKPRQTFQPYGVPNIDDRRRLPSYARDATSEVVSMYETASQKFASRMSEGHEYRTHSMTQTSSYSSYTLSNHRSYASLRSQPEGSGSLQRSRSPFAYPARLRRPGFRPSSPALTDGGLVDYRRRAEIDQLPNGFSHSNSSPASLYAQKRKPPLSLRADGNRSTPSLLSQPSPPRRSFSPYVTQSNGPLRNESTCKNDPASENTSPARSTFSLAATVNLYGKIPVSSVTSTSGKLPSTSPLYYDYTEDFYVQDCNPQESAATLPQFYIDIPAIEENRNNHGGPVLHGKISDNGTDNSSSASSYVLKSAENSLSGDIGISEPTQAFDKKEAISSTASSTPSDDKKKIRPSGLGYGAQELSNHVEEAFGLLPLPSFEISLEQNNIQGVKAGAHIINQTNTDPETNSNKTLARGIAIKLQQSPPTPSSTTSFDAMVTPTGYSTTSEVAISREPTLLGYNNAIEDKASQELNKDKLGIALVSTSSIRTHIRSSGFTSINAGLDELANLIRNVDDANLYDSEFHEPSILLPGITPMSSPSIPDNSLLMRISYSDRSQSIEGSSFNRKQAYSGDKKSQTEVSRERHKHQHKDRGFRLPAVPNYDSSQLHEFGLQMPRKFISCSEPPMLAPKPISPARQLKLKNSIPQLMKALPPLPLEPLVRAFHPPGNRSYLEIDFPCRFSPLLPEHLIAPVEEPLEEKKTSIMQTKNSVSMVVHDLERELIAPIPQENPQSPPKLRLRMKSSNSLRPSSTPSSRPWNYDESYPWSKQEPEVCLPISRPEKLTSNKPPKFKLKITRATGSTQGTVRINHDSSESSGLSIFNPPDLFTPSKLDNVIRHVSRRLQSRKTSATSNSGSEALNPTVCHAEELAVDYQRSNSEVPGSSLVPNPLVISEANSEFSDDSSHTQGPQGLRKRLSNLRARIAVPYASRLGSLSLDDLTWRDRNAPQIPKSPATTRSISILRSRKPSSEPTPMRRFGEKVQSHRLTVKMRAWIHGARSRITARIKARGKSFKGSDDSIQLTKAM